ncbi:hypothetical protein QQX98_006028 [Neonectria punicea]|uniref:N-acetyltransferase domain-containing protein n=1 Tax=Neonectria punicea TaxID=979145 RepID=A0ABR1H306_9HYPO
MAFDIVVPSENDAADVASTHLAAMDPNLLMHAQFPNTESLDFLRGWLRKDTLDHIAGDNKGVLIARDTETGKMVGFVKWNTQRQRRPGDKEEEEHEEEFPACCRQEYLDSYAELTKEARRKVLGDRAHYRKSLTHSLTRLTGKRSGSGSREQWVAQCGQARPDNSRVELMHELSTVDELRLADGTSSRAELKLNSPTHLFLGPQVADSEAFLDVTYLCTHPEWSGRGAASRLLREVQAKAAADRVPAILEATMNAVTFYERLGFDIRLELAMMLPPRGSSEPTEHYAERTMVWQQPQRP